MEEEETTEVILEYVTDSGRQQRYPQDIPYRRISKMIELMDDLSVTAGDRTQVVLEYYNDEDDLVRYPQDVPTDEIYKLIMKLDALVDSDDDEEQEGSYGG